jgi:hypothetical protein
LPRFSSRQSMTTMGWKRRDGRVTLGDATPVIDRLSPRRQNERLYGDNRNMRHHASPLLLLTGGGAKIGNPGINVGTNTNAENNPDAEKCFRWATAQTPQPESAIPAQPAASSRSAGIQERENPENVRARNGRINRGQYGGNNCLDARRIIPCAREFPAAPLRVCAPRATADGLRRDPPRRRSGQANRVDATPRVTQRG